MTTIDRDAPPVGARAGTASALPLDAIGGGGDRLPAGLGEVDRDRVAAAVSAARSPSTRRAYAAAWQRWATWAADRGAVALPGAPEHVAAYLAERHASGLKAATIAVDRAAIAAAHKAAGLADPTATEGVRLTLAGLRRQRPEPPRRVDGLAGEDFERAIATLPDDAVGRRDRALLLVLRDGMLRRSEAAALTWADVADAGDGSGRLMIRQSKTDPEGRGAVLYLTPRTCDALRAHVADGAREPEAAVFTATRGPRAGEPLSGSGVADAVRRACEAAGLDGRYGGHSLRRGSAEALAEAGEQLPAIMTAGRWRSSAMVATYTASAEAGRGAVARVFGGRRRAS